MPLLLTDTIKISYESFGDPADPCLILISGLSSQLINWPRELLTGLVAKGFYVIVFDNRDVGLSTYYDHLGMPNFLEVVKLKQQASTFVPPYTLDDMASDVIQLMDGLSIRRAHIAGISMGGQIAQLLAIHHSHRCLSLTCIATSSGNPHLTPPSAEVLNLMLNPGPPANSLDSFLESRLKSYKIYNHIDDVDEQEACRFLQAAYLRAYHPEGNVRQLLAIMAAEARNEKLTQLQLPALVIHGDSDPVFPLDHGEELAQCIPQSELIIIDKLGHGLPRRIRAQVVELMASQRSIGLL